MKHVLLKALCGIRNEFVFNKQNIKDTGICCLIDDYLAYSIYFEDLDFRVINLTLKRLFKSWPNYSGNHLYPVPSDDPKKAASHCYALCNDFWDETTEYGRNRIDLLDWCINSLYMELYGI